MESPWISITERKPEIHFKEDEDLCESDTVLGLMKDGEVYCVKHCHWYEDEKDETNFYYTYDGEFCQQITHWMPMPPSP